MTKCGHKTCANTQAAGKLFALCLSALQLVLSQHQIETRRDISIRVCVLKFLFTQASPGFILHQTLLVHFLSTHCEGDTKGEFYHWNWPYLQPSWCAISLNTSCEIHTHTNTHHHNIYISKRDYNRLMWRSLFWKDRRRIYQTECRKKTKQGI